MEYDYTWLEAAIETFSGLLISGSIGLSTLAFLNYSRSRQLYIKGQQHYEEGLKFHKEAQAQVNEAKAELRFWKEQSDQLMESRELQRRLN